MKFVNRILSFVLPAMVFWTAGFILGMALTGCSALVPDVPDASGCLSYCADDLSTCLDNTELCLDSCAEDTECANECARRANECLTASVMCLSECVEQVEDALN